MVRAYLEAAWEARISQVRIVHGRGTGVLRETVRSLLSRHPRVLSYGDAPAHQGGWGATLAVLGEGKADPGAPPAETDPGPGPEASVLLPWVLLGGAFLAALVLLIWAMVQVLSS